MLVLTSRFDVCGYFPQIPTVVYIDFQHLIDLRRIKRQPRTVIPHHAKSKPVSNFGLFQPRPEMLQSLPSSMDMD
jgi:hypothetical protein